MAITIGLIKGLMLGLEYDELDDGVFCIVLDLGFVRTCVYLQPQEEEE